MHGRFTPVKHDFSYPVYGYLFDLDEIDELSRKVSFFGHNTVRPVSLYDCDYLDGASRSIKDRLLEHLARSGCTRSVSRVELITSARYFNYVFNPVSFYYCYGPDGALEYNVAEINNTFKERHLYILDKKKPAGKDFVSHYTGPVS